MIKIELHLPDGRNIQALVRERHYKKLTAKIENMSFWEKFKLLFFNKKEIVK